MKQKKSPLRAVKITNNLILLKKTYLDYEQSLCRVANVH